MKRSRRKSKKGRPPPVKVVYRADGGTPPDWYEEYLKSEHWQEMREKALKRAEHRCQICYFDRKLSVHHRTYERVGREKVSDLTVLCGKCHALFHRHGRVVR